MLVIHHPDQALHDPDLIYRTGRMIEQPERAERYHALLDSVRQDRHEIVEAPLGGMEPILAIHDGDYVEFLRTVFDRWSAIPGYGKVAVPNVHPTHRMHRKPLDLLGEFGWYSNSTSCPITSGTWPAVVASAQVAVHGADRILSGTRAAYALCRPPGHHAFPDLMTGVCFLNNAAIAAHYLTRRLGKVAIIDIDAHHPNGTQHIFWERGDTLLCSVHADPRYSPPYYAGYANEMGEGAGRGLNCNYPLPASAGDMVWLETVELAIMRIEEFSPQALVLCVGFDASEHDSYEPALKVTDKGFAEAARRIATVGLPTLIVQEGGYLNAHLGRLLQVFLHAFEESARNSSGRLVQGTT
jgi:acetoin utilization deacetylase AcuC-like enzyme